MDVLKRLTNLFLTGCLNLKGFILFLFYVPILIYDYPILMLNFISLILLYHHQLKSYIYNNTVNQIGHSISYNKYIGDLIIMIYILIYYNTYYYNKI